MTLFRCSISYEIVNNVVIVYEVVVNVINVVYQ